MGTGATQGIIPNNGMWGYSPAQTPETFNQSTLAPLAGVLTPYMPLPATSVTDLRSLASSNVTRPSVYLEGRLSAGDGGQGTFHWSTSDLSTEVSADTRAAVYVAPNFDSTGAQGAWVRDFLGPLNLKWFGAIGDGSTDDTAAIAAWISLGSTVFASTLARSYYAPSGNYFTTAGITLPATGRFHLYGDGERATVFTLDSDADVGTKLLNIDPAATAIFSIEIDHLRLNLAGVEDSIGIYCESAQEDTRLHDLLIAGAPTAGTVNTGGWGMVFPSTSPSTNLVEICNCHIFNVDNGIQFVSGTNFTARKLTIDRNFETGDTTSVGIEVGSGRNIQLREIHMESFAHPITISGTTANVDISMIRASHSAVALGSVIEIASGCHHYSCHRIENFDEKFAHTISDLDRSIDMDGEIVGFVEASRATDQLGGESGINSLITNAPGAESLWPGDLTLNNGHLELNQGEFTPGDTTPSVAGGNVWTVDNSGEAGNVFITDFDNAADGTVIYVKVSGAGTKTRFKDADIGPSSLNMGGADVTANANDVFVFIRISATWYGRLLSV